MCDQRKKGLINVIIELFIIQYSDQKKDIFFKNETSRLNTPISFTIICF